MGPEPYGGESGRTRRQRKPEWVRILEEDVDKDPEVARLLEGTDGDPDRIREKMRYALKEQDVHREGQGSEEPPRVSFRAISPVGLWVWLQFLDSPTAAERELLEGVLKSWFAVGKLGGYNSQNLQVYQNADDDQSFFEYDNDELGAGESRMASYIHDMGELEYQGDWARVWVDMGTADELCLDVLLNLLAGFSAQMCGLRAITLGGANEDWPVPPDLAGGLMGPEDQDYMNVDIDPMRVPTGLDEEFQFMDEEGMLEGGKGRRAMQQAAAGREDGGGGSGGYGVEAGPYGATAEQRELQQLAARLGRRPAVAGSSGGGSGPARTQGYYGAGGEAGRARGLGADLDLDPDLLQFLDEGEDGSDAEDGGKAAAGSAASPVPKRPWGSSFIRRIDTKSRAQ